MAGRRKVRMQTPTGDQDWTIRQRRLSRNQHCKYYGLCHWDRHLIEIDPRLDNINALRTIIHEPTHVALGRDFDEPAVERIEHNVLVAVSLFLKERFGLDLLEEE